MRKFLKLIYVLQERYDKKKGIKVRANPYNPLSYVAIVISLIVGVLMFGFVGIKEEIDFTNPFKWN